jgi:asparagine synthase (glutamine-hydrolysing)
MPGIAGIITSRPNRYEVEPELSTMLSSMLRESFYTHGTHVSAEDGWYFGWVNHRASFSDCNPIVSKRGDRILLFTGEHFSGIGPAPHGACSLLDLFAAHGDDFVRDLNGWFAGLLIDLTNRRVVLFNDRFGMHRIYYAQTKDSFIFASEAKSILSVTPDARRLDERGLGEFLAVGCVLENRTLFSNVRSLPGGSAWSFSQGMEPVRRSYFHVEEWERQPALSEASFYAALRDNMRQVAPAYFRTPGPVGLSLTGGLDTRIITATPRPAGQLATCYTYRGAYRDCFDIEVARQVAAACKEPYQVLHLDDDFFDDFARCAEDTVWCTDGTLDITGAHEIYFSRKARELSMVRLTGNYGSEILRSVSTFKYTPPEASLFTPEIKRYVDEAASTFTAVKSCHDVSFAAFKEVPWNLHGRLFAAQSQLIVRSPYMDNRIVSLMYQAPPGARTSNRVSLRLIGDLNPALLQIPTDMGYGGNTHGLGGGLSRLMRYLLFKAEWYYNAGMPDWIVRFDKPVLAQLEPVFLGRHKIEHYRVWYRDRLFDYVQSILSDPASAARPYLNRGGFNRVLNGHCLGTGNYMNAITKLITLELIQRLFTDRESRVHLMATRGAAMPSGVRR